MQNKGFVMVFAILLFLVCCFYLSFSAVTSRYEKKAVQYATDYASVKAKGDAQAYDRFYNQKYKQYLDSMSTEKVWPWLQSSGHFGYNLKECREHELGLGLDLKGGMSVIVEVDVAAVLRSIGDVDNQAFVAALNQTSAQNLKGSNRDYISLFIDNFVAKNGSDKLAPIFCTKLRDRIQPTDKDAQVIPVLREELASVADNSFKVLHTRIDRFGVVAPNIQKLDNRAERIVIELPGIKEPDRVRKLLQGSANLEFWKTYSLTEIQGYLSQMNESSMAAISAVNKDTAAVSTPKLSKKDKRNKIVNLSKTVVATTSVPKLGFKKPLMQYFTSLGGGAIVGFVNKDDTAAVNTILHKYSDIYPSDLKFGWGFKPQDKKETLYALYALRGDGIKRGAALDGSSVVDAKASLASQHGLEYQVSMTMNSYGTQRWSSITEAAAREKASIAIVMDGYVYSAPTVQSKIDGGTSSITGHFSNEEANDLENVLKSGKMKAGVHIVQEEIIGPSLGQEAIKAGIISFVIALVLIMIYMCFTYGLIPGLISDIALLLNLFFTIGILASFGAVMTLPGITGLVLTLAMAVDANVLIYERTKEELRAGKPVKIAIMDGYKHAFSAIFDANVAHVVTAAILIAFGTGTIKGFATTAIIGVIVSFFTAVFMTRMFYAYMIQKGKFKNLQFSTTCTRKLFVENKINFLGKMTTRAITISIIVIVIGIVSMFIHGLNKGIDFTGGRNYLVRFDKKVDATKIEEALTPEFKGYTVRVLTSGSASQSSNTSQVRITTNYKVEDTSNRTESEIKSKMTRALKSYIAEGSTIDKYIQSAQHVGPSVADDLKTASTIAVVIAVIIMAAYILLRFRDIAFSVGTFVAVVHDALIVILLYSILYKVMPFSMEIDQSFIAAILTVVGYSINDKVVIFDRIRELRHVYPNRDVTLTINEALNSTLGRTVNTSLCALLVVLCIFVLGGDTIRSFSFAIFIGIFIGTYSSVFIATPVAWRMLKKKQKQVK